MSIVFKLDPAGGFVVGDTETRQTTYAHPRSPYAEDAVGAPGEVAARMAATANTNPVMLPPDFLVRYNEANWSRLRDADEAVVSVMGGRAW